MSNANPNTTVLVTPFTLGFFFRKKETTLAEKTRSENEN